MNEHDKQTEFLRHIMLYDDTDARHELEKRITQVQRDLRCVKRAISMTAVFPLLMVAGFGYGVILEENFPYDASRFVIKVICELGLASLICLAVFAGLWTFYRGKLNQLRGECRQSVRRLLVSRLGEPHIAEVRGNTCDVSIDLDVANEAVKNSGSPIGKGPPRKLAPDNLEHNRRELKQLAAVSSQPVNLPALLTKQ